MSTDEPENSSQPKVASLRTAVCSHPAVGACLVAGVALIEKSPAVASLVIVAALIFGMVEGKIRTRPAKRPQQDPQEQMEEGDTPYGFSRSGTAPRKTLAGAGILPVGQGVEVEVGVGKPGIRAFRAEPSEQSHGRGYARGDVTDRGRRAMEMWTRRQRAEAALREVEESQEEIIHEFQSSLQIC